MLCVTFCTPEAFSVVAWLTSFVDQAKDGCCLIVAEQSAGGMQGHDNGAACTYSQAGVERFQILHEEEGQLHGGGESSNACGSLNSRRVTVAVTVQSSGRVKLSCFAVRLVCQAGQAPVLLLLPHLLLLLPSRFTIGNQLEVEMDPATAGEE